MLFKLIVHHVLNMSFYVQVTYSKSALTSYTLGTQYKTKYTQKLIERSRANNIQRYYLYFYNLCVSLPVPTATPHEPSPGIAIENEASGSMRMVISIGQPKFVARTTMAMEHEWSLVEKQKNFQLNKLIKD